MVGRYTGACLGLLAFAVTIVAGMVVHNPPVVTLSRAVIALLVFCVVGLAVGGCAQSVVNDHYRRRKQEELAPEGDGGGPALDQPAPERTPEVMEAKVVGT